MKHAPPATLRLAENKQKPFLGPGGFSSDQDDRYLQFWGPLVNTDGGQEIVWQGVSCSNLSNCQHSNIIRQWAELAYWFPFRTHAVGSSALSVLPSSSNLDFTSYAPTPPSTTAQQIVASGPHSYLTESPYPVVFQAWKSVTGVLK